VLIYSSFCLLAQHWLPWAACATVWIGVFLPNMLRKERSMARYPEHAAWVARTGLLLPSVPTLLRRLPGSSGPGAPRGARRGLTSGLARRIVAPLPRRFHDAAPSRHRPRHGRRPRDRAARRAARCAARCARAFRLRRPARRPGALAPDGLVRRGAGAPALPGVSLAVVRDQEILYARGFGHAHLETKSPATAKTMYSICSISKLFTGVAVMQQRDAGKLRLDDPVSKHLPWFAIGGVPDGAPPVTVFGLLTHSSGLPRESDVPYWTGPAFPFPPAEAVREKVGGQEMLYRPETVFQYSNLGLTLAGEVAAAAAGRPWADLVRGGILEPLGMKDTETDHRDRWRGNRLASGYTSLRRDGRERRFRRTRCGASRRRPG